VRIRHLTASRAEAAILKPLARLNQLVPDQEPWTAEPELVRRVLEGVQVGRVVLAVVGRGQAAAAARPPPDPPIETPYLQMVLTRLWARETEQGSRRLRLRTLEALGGPQQIVRTHLDEALDGLPAAQQEVAAALFHYLVTPSGSKIGHSAVDLANYARFSAERVRAVLAALSAPDARIVRPVPAPPGLGEEPRYEIFHDVLAPAILGWRAQWAARRQAEAAAHRQLEQRARRWRRSQGLAAVLVAVLVAVGAGLATRAVLDARTGRATTEAQAAELRQDVGTASAVDSGRTCRSRRPSTARSPPSSTTTSRACRPMRRRRRCWPPAGPRRATTCCAGATGSAGTTGGGPGRPASRSATRRCRCSRPTASQNPRRDSWRGSRCQSLATLTRRSR
jgi:hypothetical protein